MTVLVFAACIPATPPPNLNATPGAAVIVTETRYQNDLFSVEYPMGWRVITSQAGVPPSVTFVAPGDCTLITVSSVPLAHPPTAPACDQPSPPVHTSRRIPLGDLMITVAGGAPADEWRAFLAVFNHIAESVRAV